MTTPDLPPPADPITVEVFLARWPSAAHACELIDGALVFSGAFDARDVAAAQRTYPGRDVSVDADGALWVRPAS